MRVRVLVEIDTEWTEDNMGDPKPGDPLYDRVQDSVVEAVQHAIDYGEENGFCHDLDAVLALSVHSVELAAPTTSAAVQRSAHEDQETSP